MDLGENSDALSWTVVFTLGYSAVANSNINLG